MLPIRVSMRSGQCVLPNRSVGRNFIRGHEKAGVDSLKESLVGRLFWDPKMILRALYSLCVVVQQCKCKRQLYDDLHSLFTIVWDS